MKHSNELEDNVEIESTIEIIWRILTIAKHTLNKISHVFHS